MKNILGLIIILLFLVTGWLAFQSYIAAGTGGIQDPSRYFIPIGIAFTAEVIGLAMISTYESSGGTKALLVGLVIPIVALGYIFNQNQKDNQRYTDYKAAQESNCTQTQIQQYRYKVCAGGFTPIGVCDAGYGTQECVNAIKVWDQNH